ncbi:hypothetical protein WKI65_43815 [Streptomyces sp. MS1.AVA.3]|uniref:hypothetical protein n=1 Tax=Streptomyces decoyicus TaxID=249567 RepID=UPI0030C2ED14
MRKIISGTALVLTAALLTGCGSGDGPSTADKAANASVKPKPDSGSAEVKHEVTLEVLGHGNSQVYYNLSTNKFEKVKLPWRKTETITLTTEAEKRIGTTVTVVPGSVYNADGTLRAAACVITVDGKKVADNKGGKSNKMCRYDLK